MKNWIRLLVPLGLGILAGGVNYVAMTSEVAKFRYTVMKTDLEWGTAFDVSSFTFLESNGDWTRTAIPYEKRGLLYGLAAPRSMKPGDVVLWQDIRGVSQLSLNPGEMALNVSMSGLPCESALIKIGSRLGFAIPKGSVFGSPTTSSEPNFNTDDIATRVAESYEVLGPYRVVSVGGRTADRDDESSRGSENITVAARLEADGKTLNPEASRLLAASISHKITSVTIYPPQTEPTSVAESVTTSAPTTAP